MNDRFSEIELRKLDLNLLLVFAAIMRERSVGKAAGRLYLGSSAVSMALARLREAIGDPLFVRSGAVMEPTSRALRLWDELEPALASIERAVRGTRAFDPESIRRDVRIAVPDDLEFVLVPRLLDRLAQDAPGIRMIARPSDFRTVLERLDGGDADLALGATPPGRIDRRFHTLRLHEEAFAVLYDRDGLGRTGALGLDEWIDTPHVLLTNSGELHGAVDEALAAMGRERHVLLGLAHFPTVPFLLRGRTCLVNMPAVAAHYFARSFDLEVCTTPIAIPPFEVSLTWHLRTDADPLHGWLRERVAGEVAALRTAIA